MPISTEPDNGVKSDARQAGAAPGDVVPLRPTRQTVRPIALASTQRVDDIMRGLGVPLNQIRLGRLRANLTGEHLAHVLADFGLLSGEGVARAQALEHGTVAYWSPEAAGAVPASRFAGLGLEVGDSEGFVPVDWDGRVLTVAVEHASRMLAAGNTFHRFSCRFVFASRHTIRHVWGSCFSASEACVDLALEPFCKRGNSELDHSVSGSEVRTLLSAILRHGCLAGASDIHLYRSGAVGLLRLTVDGIGQIFRVLPEACFERLVTRLIHDARVREDDLRQAGLREGALDPGELATLPDGGLFARYAFRIELGQARSGRTAVIRILDRESNTADFAALGFDAETDRALRRVVQQSSGLILITGPTGSGKTTTLYALLKLIDPEQVSIQSIENPVEFHHGLWMQYEVRRLADHEGVEWARWLKGLLRNAPRIILMGEVRDADTARILMEGANTGHLVFTTLHANSAASAVNRLRRLGVDDGDLADALQGILAQRLVRALCAACAEPDPHTHPHWPNLRRAHAEGCQRCSYTGYRGRRLIYEFLQVTAQVRTALLTGATSDELRVLGYLGGLTLWQSGERLLRAGVTSLEELERVTGETCTPT